MNSPFKFLDSYTKADRAIFFGRDREIEELYHKVFESKILLLYGVSGTGKSSLIDCGLGNKINDSDWLPIFVRRGGGMVESLYRQLEQFDFEVKSKKEPTTKEELDEAKPSQKVKSGVASKDIVKKIKSVYLDHFKPIYLIFDQFEELFIFGSREERSEFISIVKAIMEAEVQCKMLFSIREEYLANITEFERVVPEIMKNRMRVEKMSRAMAMEVIEGPCKVNGIGLEAGFEEALMTRLVPEGNEVELTYLQVYLDKIFKLAQGRGKEAEGARLEAQGGSVSFTLSHLDQLGNVGDLLGSFLEDQIAQLADPEAGLAILKSFVSIKGTKRQITREEVHESCKSLGNDVPEEDLKQLINKFVDLRILREKDENSRYELRHDSLAAKIYEKITLVEKELMEVRLFIENAYSTYQSRKTVLSEEDLKYIEPYQDRLFLVEELQDFVDRSRYDIDAAKRSFRKIIAISIAGFILFVAAFVIYYNQKSVSNDLRYFALNAKLMEEGLPELGLDFAANAYQQDTSSSISKNVLISAFNKKLEKEPDVQKALFNFEPEKYPVEYLDLSSDGQYLFGWLQNNDAKVWSLVGREIWSKNIEGQPIKRMRMSDNNEYAGMLLDDSTINICGINGVNSFKIKTSPNKVNDKYLFDFTCRKEIIVAAIRENKVLLYDTLGNISQVLDDSKNSLNTIDISPDRRFLAAGNSDGMILIWYYNRNSAQFQIYTTIDRASNVNIWSCQFNSESNYILSAAEDSTTTIMNLKGEINDNRKMLYFPGYYYDMRYRLFKSANGSESDAYFAKGERILVLRLREDELDPDSLTKKTNLNLVHDPSSDFNKDFKLVDAVLSRDLFNKLEESGPVRYDFLVPAPDTRSLATVVEGEKEINIIASDHYPLFAFEGTNPVYSNDSKSIFSIRGNSLEKHIIDPTEIVYLVWRQKIFGDLDYEPRDWVSY